MSFLGNDLDWVITFKGKGYHLGVCNSDETSGGDPLEFNCLHRVGSDPGYMVYPCWSGVVSRDSFTDPVPYLKTVSVSCGIWWDTHYDDFSIIPVGGMVGHPKGLEAFPCPTLRVPKIFDLGVVIIGNGTSFTTTTHSQGVSSHVEDVKVVENGLFENLRLGCGFELYKTNYYVKPRAKYVLPEWAFRLFELGGNKELIYVREAWSFPVHREMDLIYSVP